MSELTPYRLARIQAELKAARDAWAGLHRETGEGIVRLYVSDIEALLDAITAAQQDKTPSPTETTPAEAPTSEG